MSGEYLMLNRQQNIFLVDHSNEYDIDSGNELGFIHIKYQKLIKMINTLNSIDSFIMSIVIF